MMAWRPIRTFTICIFVFVSLAALCLAEAGAGSEMTPAEFGAELDRVLAAIQQPGRRGPQTAELLRTVPLNWRVHTGRQTLEISAEWLRRDLIKTADGSDPELEKTIQRRLQTMRAEVDGYQKPPRDVSAQRALLTTILARKEFRDIHGPTWSDRLRQWLFRHIANFLGRIFSSSSIPTVGKIFIYCLAGLAVLALAVWAYRSIRGDAASEQIIPAHDAVSAKEWTIWMAEAREAAKRENWREAIHLAYWAGISFLEAQGMWKPDSARTPREYLRLMPQSSDRHPVLAALTRSFEIVWYGKRDADSQAFSQTLRELEKLGCS